MTSHLNFETVSTTIGSRQTLAHLAFDFLQVPLGALFFTTLKTGPFIPILPRYLLLGSLTVPRMWMGLWQLSSPAWGTAPASKIRAEMNKHLQYGFTTFGK